MARKKPGGGGDHGGGGGGGHGGASGRWLVSYADFMTLMFVVFTVLYAFANVDKSKYGKLADSLRQAIGPAGPDVASIPARGQLGTPMPVVPPERPGNLPDIPDWPAQLVAEAEEVPFTMDPTPSEPPPADAQPSNNPEDPLTVDPSGPVEDPTDELVQLEDTLRALPGFRSGLLAVTLEERGLNISIAGNVLFEPGQVVLREEAKQILTEIIPDLQDVLVPIWIIGTADEQPVAGALSPEALAALRSAAVTTFFREAGLDSSEFVQISYSGGDQQDYRVSIIVVRQEDQ